MTLKADFESNAGTRTAEERKAAAMMALCGQLVPIDGLYAAARAAYQQHREQAQADYEKSEPRQKLERVRARAGRTAQSLAIAASRSDNAEAALRTAIEADVDDAKIVAARNDLKAATADVDALRRETEIVAGLQRDAERDAEHEHNRIHAQARTDFLEDQQAAANSALADVMAVLQSIAEAIAQYATAVHVLSSLQQGVMPGANLGPATGPAAESEIVSSAVPTMGRRVPAAMPTGM